MMEPPPLNSMWLRWLQPTWLHLSSLTLKQSRAVPTLQFPIVPYLDQMPLDWITWSWMLARESSTLSPNTLELNILCQKWIKWLFRILVPVPWKTGVLWLTVKNVSSGTHPSTRTRTTRLWLRSLLTSSVINGSETWLAHLGGRTFGWMRDSLICSSTLVSIWWVQNSLSLFC